MQIERCNNVISRDRRRGDFLGRFASILVEGQFVLSVLALQHVVERLLDSFASFSFRPEHFMILDKSVRIAAGFTSITNDLTSEASIWISAHINGPQLHCGGQLF